MKNQDKTIKDKIKIKALGLRSLLNVQDYKNIVEIEEYKRLMDMTYKEETSKTLRQLNTDFNKKIYKLNYKHQELVKKMTSENEQKLKGLMDSLEGFVGSVKEVLALDSTKCNFLLENLKKKLPLLNSVENNINQDLRIDVSFNDFNSLLDNTNWHEVEKQNLQKILKIDKNLSDGIAVLNNNSGHYFISYIRAKKTVEDALDKLKTALNQEGGN